MTNYIKRFLPLLLTFLLGGAFTEVYGQGDGYNVCTGSTHGYTGYCETTGETSILINNVTGPAPATFNSSQGTVTYGNVPGIYRIYYSYDSPCTAPLYDEVHVSRNYATNPFPYQVTGTWNSCTQTGSITLAGSDRATQYYLERSGGVRHPDDKNSAETYTGSHSWAISVPGTYTVYALTDLNGCSSEVSVPIGSYVISNTPTVYTVSINAPCGVKLASSQLGITYQVYKDGVYVNGQDKAGTAAALSWALTQTGTYTVKATNGCTTATMSGSVVLAMPALYQVAGGGTYCQGGTGMPVTLSSSQTGISYQLRRGGVNTGTALNGTGSLLTWANQTTGSYTVVATSTSGCSQTMTGTATISSPTPPQAYTLSGGGSYPPGGYGLSITLSGSQTATNYQLKFYGANSGPVVIGTGSTLTWPYQTAGTYTVVATSGTTGCSLTMSGSVSITINAGAVVPANTGIENYIKTTTISAEGKRTDADIANALAGETHITYQYMDGLGRPIQQVNVKASPAGYDLVQFAAYDKYGNQPVSYLSYASSSQDGRFQTNAAQAQLAFYNRPGDRIADDSKPFAVSRLENSPSGRILEQGAPGADWQPGTGHTALGDFRLNTVEDHVKIWTTTGPSGEYPANKLIVSKVTNANGNHMLLFSDKLGRKILKRVQLDENITENNATSLVNYLETYFVYNDYGQIIYQVPPKAVAKLNGGATWTTAFINEWIFSYSYDALGRLVQKKVPASAPVYICYDKLDRPILVQDGKSRLQNKWFYVKYDLQERPVLEGIYVYTDPGTTGATPQEKLQNYLNGLNYSLGSLLSYEEKQSGTTHGYSNHAFPTTGTTLLSVHYYDDYDFNADGTPDYSYVAQGLPGEKTTPQANSFGNVTGSKSLILGTSNWLVSYTFYDKYGQPIQARGNNHLSLVVDNLSTSVYNYDGTLKVTKAYHKAGVGKEVTVINKFEYDLKGRLKKVFQNNNTAPTDQLVAQYEYNELGQLVDKKLHGVGPDFLQSIDYRYNIRGWLSHINSSKLEVNVNDINANNDESNDLFGMELLYNTVEVGLNDQVGDKRYWNGNVSAVKWKVKPGSATTQNANPIRERSYKFDYDKVNRLKKATYQAYSGTAWNVETGGYNETMTYDHNGNILSLTRNTLLNGGTTPTIIDNLTYSYTAGLGNQLKKVEDASSNASGFNNAANIADEYGYDENGNLSRDNNKGISQIDYNELNKISLITYTDGRKIRYTYEANGSRLKKEVFQSAATTPSKTVDYAGSFVYENASLSYFGMAEGRVRTNGTSFVYEYFIKDHQGNVRVSFEAFTSGGTTVAKLIQENHYYPFGMSITGIAIRTASPSNPNKLLFNGASELQDDFGDSPGTYSTGFREYDPILGRFNGVDPLADQFSSWTPYTYAYNNPIGFSDPSGAASIADIWNNPNGGTWTPEGGGRTFSEGEDDKWAIEYLKDHGGLAEGTEEEIKELYDLLMGDSEAAAFYMNAKAYGSVKIVDGTLQLTTVAYSNTGREFNQRSYNLAGSEVFLDGLQIVLDGIGMTEIPFVSQGAELVSAGVSFYRGDIYGGLTGLGSMLPIAGKAFEGMKIARLAKKGLKAAENVKGGKTIGLGLAEDLASHRGTGAITYKAAGWQQAGLTKVDWGRASIDDYYFKESFIEASQNASAIKFNVSSFNPAYSKPGITNFEFNHIIGNSSLLQKTEFIKDGDTVFWNGAEFIK